MIWHLYIPSQYLDIVLATLLCIVVILCLMYRSAKQSITMIEKQKYKEVKQAIQRYEERLAEAKDGYEECKRNAAQEVEIYKKRYHAIKQQMREESLIFAETIVDYTRERDESGSSTLSILLDELEKEFGYTNPGQALRQARKEAKKILNDGSAVMSTSDNARYRRRGIEFTTALFEYRLDSIFKRLNHENCSELLGELRHVYTTVNANTNALFQTKITREYFQAKVNELKAAGTVKALQKISRDEQRALAEQKRDEEKARREIEKAEREAAREQEALHKAMEQARVQMETATAEERIKFEAQMEEMRKKLEAAEAKGQRAKSMAQLTRRGNVYVISNIGSFGEDVIKIGMTRRFNPDDRIKELASASVPFPFDIHAMIETDDAPALEMEMHQAFNAMRVNKVNFRKEFFRISIQDVKNFLESKGLIEASRFTMKARASEYRDSLVIESMPEETRDAQMSRLAKAEQEAVTEGEEEE